MMRFKFVALVLTSTLALACASASAARHSASSACPQPGLGETAEDCPWAGVARVLVEEAEAGKTILPRLKELLPELSAQMAADSERTYLKYLWGKSINFDELANGVIVHPSILESIAQIFGENGTGRIVHAGMEHTYGYLFSILRTSFGYKRARWVRPTIEEGLEVGGKGLSPMPEEGTFFSNITYFMAEIAFRNDPSTLESLRKSAKTTKHFSSAVVSYPYSALPITRLEETIRVQEGNAPARTVILRTDFVPFKKIPAGQGNSHLLVYSIYDSAVGTAQLVTAFPVEESFVQRGLKKENLGSDQPIITRYNAYVEGITGKSLKGERKVIPPSKRQIKAR